MVLSRIVDQAVEVLGGAVVEEWFLCESLGRIRDRNALF